MMPLDSRHLAALHLKCSYIIMFVSTWFCEMTEPISKRKSLWGLYLAVRTLSAQMQLCSETSGDRLGCTKKCVLVGSDNTSMLHINHIGRTKSC